VSLALSVSRSSARRAGQSAARPRGPRPEARLKRVPASGSAVVRTKIFVRTQHQHHDGRPPAVDVYLLEYTNMDKKTKSGSKIRSGT